MDAGLPELAAGALGMLLGAGGLGVTRLRHRGRRSAAASISPSAAAPAAAPPSPSAAPPASPPVSPSSRVAAAGVAPHAAAGPPLAGDLVDILTSPAVLLDGRDGLVRANPPARALGLVRAGDVTSDLLALARQTRRDGIERTAELALPRRRMFARSVVNLVARAAPFPGGSVVVLIEDRTEAARLEAVRRDFVANISHELKTPVGALHLLAEAVLSAADDEEAVRRFAGRMRAEADRLSTLVQDVIDLSRLQDANAVREPRAVQLDDVVAEAVDRVRLGAAARDIAVVVGGDGGLSVLGDEDLLTGALRNLLDNAISYSPDHTRVAVAVRAGEYDVEISVTDQGIGIPERELERIFERFYRVDPARSRRTGGTGLGLSIVKHVVANHGGDIDVWSVEGAGSTFTIRLPLPREGNGEVPDAAASASRRGRTVSAESGARK